MKSQYLPQICMRCRPGVWLNATSLITDVGDISGIVDSEELAQECISKLKQRFRHDAKLCVVDSRILVRLVSDWEQLNM